GEDGKGEGGEVGEVDERQVAGETPGAVEPARLCFVVETLLRSGHMVEVPEPEVVADGGDGGNGDDPGEVDEATPVWAKAAGEDEKEDDGEGDQRALLTREE